MISRCVRAGLIAVVLTGCPVLQAADWLHWRGPEQTGVAKEVLPESFELGKAGAGNLLWKAELGGRSAPIVMNGKLFFIQGYDVGKLTEGERVVCLDADTGKLEWDYKFGVFHTDIVSSRLGWTSLAADPETGTLFTHSTAGHLFALDAKTGKLNWQHQLTEEYGRVTGYGGRISSPLFDSGLVIVGIVNGSWGDGVRGNNRFVAFDGKTGKLVWWSSPTEEINDPSVALRGTYYSNPVVAVVNGQRTFVSGAADGCVHGFKVRTGERIWSHHFSAGVVNPSPVVDGNLVYCFHGEENPGGGGLGRAICLDMSVLKDKKPKIVWENRNLARRFGLASPALADGKIYMPEDGGELFCFDAKTGKVLWKYKFGTVARGAPLICGGKAYIFEVLGKLSVIKLGNKEPDSDEDVVEYRFKPRSGVGQLETNGTPIAVNGKLYIQTLDDIYCIGTAGSPPGSGTTKVVAETPFDEKAAPAKVMIFPADITAKPGEAVVFELRFVDGNGRLLPTPADAKVEWTLPLPPKTPTGAQPPALAGQVAGDAKAATLTLEKLPAQQGYLDATVGKLKARARIRVAPQLPLKQDFGRIPVGGAPSGWVNAQGKYEVLEVELDGKMEKVLSKINNNPRPPVARANAYITVPSATNYTVQADVRGGEVEGKLPDMGVIANRYVFQLDGKEDTTSKKRDVRLVSWEARNRVNEALEFNWKKDTWYTMKLSVEVADKKATVRGKVWERSQPEPKDWTISFVDPNPNTEGAAAIYGYVANVRDSEKGIVPGSPIYYQNVSVTPNAK